MLVYLSFMMFHRKYWISGDEKFKAVAFSNIFVRALNKYIIHCIGIFLYIFFWFIVASELLSHKIHKPININ